MGLVSPRSTSGGLYTQLALLDAGLHLANQLIIAPTSDAAAVAQIAYDEGLATEPRPYNLLAYIKEQMYQPDYISFV